jgi:hypothetical protein
LSHSIEKYTRKNKIINIYIFLKKKSEESMLGLLPVGHDGEAANFKVNLFAQFFLLILMVPNFAQPDWTMGHL